MPRIRQFWRVMLWAGSAELRMHEPLAAAAAVTGSNTASERVRLTKLVL